MDSFLFYDSTGKGLQIGFKETFKSGDQGIKVKGMFRPDSGDLTGRVNLLNKFQLAEFPRAGDDTSVSPGLVYDFGEDDAKLRVSGKKRIILDNKNTWVKFKGWGEWSLKSQDLKDYNAEAKVELTHTWFDFNAKQDLKLKVGLKMDKKDQDPIAFVAARENNWRLEANSKKQVFVRYDL